MTREINAAEYEAEVLGSSVPVLLDVYGEHCPPCRQLAPVIEKLGCPLMICNGLTVDEDGYISDYRTHHLRGKAGAVTHFQRLGFQVIAVGDSLNDLSMLTEAAWEMMEASRGKKG